mmetsp:Transcript_33702/g.73960  ORF Transcript_33702/g.73960 Transcript_33702/m.73960 type:complete len:98 (+) Transcript_33702:111-404(+)
MAWALLRKLPFKLLFKLVWLPLWNPLMTSAAWRWGCMFDEPRCGCMLVEKECDREHACVRSAAADARAGRGSRSAESEAEEDRVEEAPAESAREPTL